MDLTWIFQQGLDWGKGLCSICFDPILPWYIAGVVGGVVLIILAIFLPFKTTRILLGLAFVGIAVYIAGGRHMNETNKAEIARLKALLRERKDSDSQDGQDGGGGIFGGGLFGGR